jgi:hypothetical protein
MERWYDNDSMPYLAKMDNKWPGGHGWLVGRGRVFDVITKRNDEKEVLDVIMDEATDWDDRCN